MQIFYLCFLISSTVSLNGFKHFDFVEEALNKYVNHSVDPCDNFYRHACSFSSPVNLMSDSFEKLYTYLNQTEKNLYWKEMSVVRSYPSLKGRETSLNRTVKDLLTKVSSVVCDKDVDRKLLPDQNVLLCDRVTMSFETLEKYLNLNTLETIIGFNRNITVYNTTLNGIRAIVDVDVREGMEKTRNMLINSLDIAVNLIKDTPWAIKEDVVKKIEKITRQLELHDNYGKDFKKYTDMLFRIEKRYTHCKTTFHSVKIDDSYCYIMVALENEFWATEEQPFDIVDFAMNGHPYIYIGYPNFYHTQYGTEMASKLGYTGFTVSHEIAHSFIDKHRNLRLLPFFSDQATECIQGQYKKTCLEYKEESCDTNINFLEDNGADIFGLQLAHKLMQNYYGKIINDRIEELDVTNNQLFFYSFAFQFCSKDLSFVSSKKLQSHFEHSANNVRVNVAAQHPAFKKAFKCLPNSKMMKSVTEQCHIYGRDAPDTKKGNYTETA